MSDCCMQNFSKRRSVYALGKGLDKQKTQIIQNISTLVKHAPTAFNSQSSRVVILFKEHHQKFWEITLSELQKLVPEQNFEATKRRIKGFSDADGTILFYEDETAANRLRKDFPQYAQNIAIWSEQSNAMLQYMIWTMLAEINIGANLQHYNPLVDVAVRNEWKLPENWRLIAQMPFGKIVDNADPKTFIPVSERFKFSGCEQ